MKSLLALVAVSVVVGGCSSAPTTTTRQYCHTSQEIRTKDREIVSSNTLVKCNDDPIEQMTIAKIGMSSNCGEYNYWMTLNGKPVERRGYACKKPDGLWEVIPANFR